MLAARLISSIAGGLLLKSSSTFAPATNSISRRHLSIKRIFASIFSPQKPIQGQTTMEDNINTVQDLERARQKLQERVQHLVGKLESMKKDTEIRLKPDQVVKSKEEQEAIAAMEQLELKETTKQAEAAGAAAAAESSTAKKAELRTGKQKGGQAVKEPEKPIDVSRLDLRVGKIVEVNKHPDADSLYVEKIDCAEPSGPRTVISGLVNHVPIEEMKDRLVVVLCNLKPVKMRGILSEAMVMCASTPDKVEILGVPDDVNPGDRVVFEKYPGEPDAQLNPKKKVWEQVSPDIKTNEEGVAMYKDCPFRVNGVDSYFKSNLKNVQIR